MLYIYLRSTVNKVLYVIVWLFEENMSIINKSNVITIFFRDHRHKSYIVLYVQHVFENHRLGGEGEQFVTGKDLFTFIIIK